jgi:hypothetical protein
VALLVILGTGRTLTAAVLSRNYEFKEITFIELYFMYVCVSVYVCMCVCVFMYLSMYVCMYVSSMYVCIFFID